MESCGAKRAEISLTEFSGVWAYTPNTRLQRRLQQVEKLAPTEKRQILQIIDAFIEREQLKKRVQSKRVG